ncbi:MAG: hypothetical protein OXU81_11090 [Gammaproteobacteria bacterium]|nr:hypothetical protein [Gammaproteobacteria bacterium]
MTTQTITLSTTDGDRWTVAVELPHDTLNPLFALSLIDGTDFDSMVDAAEAVHAAIALDLKLARA